MKNLVSIACLFNALNIVKASDRVWPHLAFSDDEDPYNKPRLEAIHMIVNGWPDDGTTFIKNETISDVQ